MGELDPVPTATAASRKRGMGRTRILVVDDDERNLLALSEVLEDVAEVVTAASGREALRALLKGDFAVILLDVFMPGMDGYETAALIREREQTARIPIIFLSAVNKETEHLMKGYAMGAVDYVFKPVDSLVLTSKVAVFVDLYEMRRQVEIKSRAEAELRDAKFTAEMEKLQIERELQASRVRQAAIIQSLPIILYLESHDGEPRCPDFVSGDLEAMTGFSFDHVRNNPDLWQQRIHPDDRDQVLKSIADRKATGGLSIEYRWQSADGSYKHFHDQAVLLRDPNGEPTEFAGTLLDVTNQRQLESQLLQAGKMEAIGQLTGGIAHDFNNLLAAVLGGIHILEKRVEFGEREQKIVDQMRRAGEQGAELVRRMMAFARRQDLKPTGVDPNVLCQSVAGLVEHTLAGTIEIDWRCVETQSNLYVDQAQLELALLNLILNARDAMPSGGKVIVEVGDADDADPSRPTLSICVSDHGSGIPPENLSKITEPFFTTKEAGKGTGLGLSMVVGFVQQSGGTIRIDSKLGEGTTIELLLPAIPRTKNRTVKGEADVAESDVTVRTLLLVDDDEAVRIVLCEQLRELGIDVEIAADGASAIERLDRGEQFDFMLTDFAMPGINGLETIRRAAASAPGMRAALMTGYADEESTAEARELVTVLRKPIVMGALVKALS